MASNRQNKSQISTEEANRIISEAAAHISMPAPPSLAIQKAAILEKIADPARAYRYYWAWRIYAGVFAMVGMLVAIIVIGAWSKGAPESFNTGSGETQLVTLKDGSTVELASNSSLYQAAAFNVDHRSVELEGEAFFDVAKGQEPFEIQIGGAQVVVVGTEFNVKQTGKNVSVHVFEGIVTLDTESGRPRGPVEIHAGWTAGFQPNQGISQPVTFFPSAWPKRSKGAFLFRDEPLSQVCTRLENYFQIQIRIDPTLAEQRVSGRIQSQDTREILDLLAALIQASWHENQGQYILTPKPSD